MNYSSIQVLSLGTAFGILITGLARAGGSPGFTWTPDRNITISAVSNVCETTSSMEGYGFLFVKVK